MQKVMSLNALNAAKSNRYNHEISTLLDIGKALTAHLSLDAVYQVVMEKISELLHPQAWSLLTVDETTQELCFEIVVSSAIAQLPSTSKDGALGQAEKLLSRLRQTTFYPDSGQPISVTGSLGVATYPTNADSVKDLIKRADNAMYRVKTSTRNGIESA